MSMHAMRYGTAVWREAGNVGPGWEPLVDELHAKVLALDSEQLVSQVKEKFGGLRYYLKAASPRIDILGLGTFQKGAPEGEEINALVREYEARSFTICEWCGETEGTTTSAPDGWLKTLCPAHVEMWGNGDRWWQKGVSS